MLAGLERPSHGRIYMGDRDVTDLPTGQRDIVMVFQSYALYPNMNVYKNLAFGPQVRKEPKAGPRAARSTRWPICSAFVTFSGDLRRRCPGGQRQRVALGRALIREPHVFLMDEPLSNLDAALRVQMRAELIRLHKRLESTTTVYVTHDQVEALTMGDRVAVLKDGVLLQVDTANDLYEYPESVFVGEFIGSPQDEHRSRHARGHERRREQSTASACASQLSARLAGRLDSSVDGGPVLVGIRPHDLQLASARRNPSAVRASGVVDIVEHTGTEVFATVDVGELKVIARLPRTPLPLHGQRMELAFDTDRVLLFDATSRRTLLGRESQREKISVGSGATRTFVSRKFKK